MSRKGGKYRILVAVVDQILELRVEDEPVIGGLVYYTKDPKLDFTISIRARTHELTFIGTLVEAMRKP